MSTVDEVGDVYDDVARTAELVGGSHHVGYWRGDDDRTIFLRTVNRFAEIICDKLDLRSGQQLLDIGCGAGARDPDRATHRRRDRRHREQRVARA